MGLGDPRKAQGLQSGCCWFFSLCSPPPVLLSHCIRGGRFMRCWCR
uniref:Uncharacterized protein n=1 Tax=Anguilla anguilla TaxID=7936 RepID=A0A0E9S9F6_ANGAN